MKILEQFFYCPREILVQISLQRIQLNCEHLILLFDIDNEILSTYSIVFIFILYFISELSCAQYERICNETLDSLSEYFEDLIEAAAHLPDADVVYGVCI